MFKKLRETLTGSKEKEVVSKKEATGKEAKKEVTSEVVTEKVTEKVAENQVPRKRPLLKRNPRRAK